MSQSFTGWIWQTFSMSTMSRAEKERIVGIVLLLTQFAWIVVPLAPIKLVLQLGQMLLGILLCLHGNYLKSIEAVERTRKMEIDWKEVFKELRESHIKRIVERDGVSLEEAAKKADEMEWSDLEGKPVPPPWMRDPIGAS